MESKISLQQSFLWSLIAAIAISALLGCYVLLAGDFGELEAKVLGTTMCIGYFSVTALSCAAAYERDGRRELSAVGIAVSVIGFVAFLPGIWGEWFEREGYMKAMGIAAITAFAVAHASLLSLTSLSRQYAWVLFSTYLMIAAVWAMAIGTIVFEWEGEWFYRIMGVFGILDAAGTIAVPILHRLSASPRG